MFHNHFFLARSALHVFNVNLFENTSIVVPKTKEKSLKSTGNIKPVEIMLRTSVGRTQHTHTLLVKTRLLIPSLRLIPAETVDDTRMSEPVFLKTLPVSPCDGAPMWARLHLVFLCGLLPVPATAKSSRTSRS